jgi:hypothetical protein
MIERVKKNNVFYEWFSVDNQPHGSGSFQDLPARWARPFLRCDNGHWIIKDEQRVKELL